MPGINSTVVPLQLMGMGDATARRTGSVATSPGATTSLLGGPAPKPVARNASFGQILAGKRHNLATSSPAPTAHRNSAPTASPAAALASRSPTMGPAATTRPLNRMSAAMAAPIGLASTPPAAHPFDRASTANVASPAPALGTKPPLGTIAPPTLSSGALALNQYPRPADDDGRGIHWVPTVAQSKATVDRFVKEADELGVRWVTFLNNGAQVGDNDYLVQELGKRGIMPVMRVFTPNGSTIDGDLGAMVRHYVAKGVPYFQLYNEPNLPDENNGREPNVDRYLDKWTSAARTVVDNGGLPGFGALAPGAQYDDLKFLRESVHGLKQRGQTNLLDRSWLSIHNYMFNRPADYNADSNGFLNFRAYDQILKEELGRSLPMIGTEGGAMVGWNQDPGFPKVDRNRQAEMIQDAFKYMGQKREPYNMAYSVWNIANKEGGAFDPSFEKGALFTGDGPSPAVAAIKALGMPAASAAVAGIQAVQGLWGALAPRSDGSAPAPSLGDRTLATAQKFLGSNYVWGGHSPAGFDCTGFTWYVNQQVGLRIPQHDLQGQMNSGPRVQKSELKAGDLVFFQNTYRAGLSHVGIATGDGRFIHAASERQGVTTSRLDDAYWAQRYVGATRPVSTINPQVKPGGLGGHAPRVKPGGLVGHAPQVQ